MRRQELHIEESESAVNESGDKMCECDLGSVAAARKHAFGKKGGADADPVDTADHPFVRHVDFHGMGMAHPVKIGVQLADRAAQPGCGPVRASLQGRFEFGVDSHQIVVSSNASGQGSRYVEGTERKDPATLGANPENV